MLINHLTRWASWTASLLVGAALLFLAAGCLTGPLPGPGPGQAALAMRVTQPAPAGGTQPVGLQTRVPPVPRAQASNAEPSPSATARRAATRRPSPSPTPLLSTPAVPKCDLKPVIAPTSAPNPGPNRLDRSTGLHMTGHARRLDLAKWRLKVTGRVANPLILTYDQLRCLPRVEEKVDLGCPGYFLDTATWAGARLADVLALAQPKPEATKLEMVSADGYTSELPLKDALAPDNLVAYEWEGQPVPILHGFPARTVIPNYDGSTWAKWLVELRLK